MSIARPDPCWRVFLVVDGHKRCPVIVATDEAEARERAAGVYLPSESVVDGVERLHDYSTGHPRSPGSAS